ncbi:hypothetical protein K438DRAFT_1774942 [Mycena galopus ATCC 62051]|nr:hypothetical protein K438DRAFT_1774942 [Mycena galopus ATCC 62051]
MNPSIVLYCCNWNLHLQNDLHTIKCGPLRTCGLGTDSGVETTWAAREGGCSRGNRVLSRCPRYYVRVLTVGAFRPWGHLVRRSLQIWRADEIEWMPKGAEGFGRCGIGSVLALCIVLGLALVGSIENVFRLPPSAFRFAARFCHEASFLASRPTSRSARMLD